MVSSRLGGGIAPKLPLRAKRSVVSSCAIGEIVETSSAVYRCRTSGAGFSGTGCVGHTFTPGMRDGVVGRS